jgi:hypothetical protein
VFFSRTLHLHAERWRRDDLFYAISDDWVSVLSALKLYCFGGSSELSI